MSHPSQIGRYHVIGRVAAGGMAEILLAKVLGPGGFERPVVIKRVHAHLVDEDEFRSMFLDEARIVAAIHHQNVVQVHELGTEGDELYLVMEYLPGESLGNMCIRAAARNVQLDLPICAHIVAEACAGLHAAHEFTDPDGKPLHVVHRDVCPSNLFVTYDGAVKVVDFGIAQAADRHTLTESGQVKGKAAYMAPEQCLHRPVDRRADVFALGVVLYELTTGHRLFSGQLEHRILGCLEGSEVPPPSQVVRRYPKELERICMRALAANREDRFQSAEEMRRELMRFAHKRMKASALPEEHLRELMRKLFDDRIEEKAELLRRLRAGTGITHIPAPHVKEQIDLPIVETGMGSGVHTPIEASEHTTPITDHRGTRHRGGGMLTALLAGGLTAALVLLATTERPSSFASYLFPPAPAPQNLPEPPSEVPLSTPPKATGSAKWAAAPLNHIPVAPVPNQVTVELHSNPSGAHIFIDDVDHGETPASLELPRRVEPMALRLELDGYETLEQSLVADMDHRVSLALSKEPAVLTAQAAPNTPTPTEAAPAKRKHQPRKPARRARGARRAAVDRPAPRTAKPEPASTPSEAPKDEFFLFE